MILSANIHLDCSTTTTPAPSTGGLPGADWDILRVTLTQDGLLWMAYIVSQDHNAEGTAGTCWKTCDFSCSFVDTKAFLRHESTWC